jgi:hypothetical protein
MTLRSRVGNFQFHVRDSAPFHSVGLCHCSLVDLIGFSYIHDRTLFAMLVVALQMFLLALVLGPQDTLQNNLLQIHLSIIPSAVNAMPAA